MAHELTFLNPFKNKPPMKGCHEISLQYADKWKELSFAAIDIMKKELEE